MIPEHCKSFAVSMTVSLGRSRSQEELLEKCDEGDHKGKSRRKDWFK